MEIVKGIKKKGKSFLKAVLPEDTYERFITWQWLRRQEIKIARKGYYIPFIVISVGQACNFRCRDCGNFAPLAPAECRRYDVDTIINNIQCILKYAPYIEGMGVQGGEPFVYNDLDKLLVYLGEQKKENRIRILRFIRTAASCQRKKCLTCFKNTKSPFASVIIV